MSTQMVRELSATEIEQVAGAGSCSFVPDGVFSASGNVVCFYSWGTTITPTGGADEDWAPNVH